MAVTTATPIVGVFADRIQADRAITALHAAGFRSDQIGVMLRDEGPHAEFRHPDPIDEAGDEASVGAVAGAAAGLGLGGLIGLGVLAGFVPVIGPALAAGTLGTILSNAAGGAAAVGLAGAMIGWGVPEDHAIHYEGELSAGRTIVTVAPEDRGAEARTILTTYGATSKDPDFHSSVDM